MSKRKAPKFNAVLEDFRKFIGESKEAEECQGSSESKVPSAKSDKEVSEILPGGGNVKGGPTDPTANQGVEATEKLPGTKEPKAEERSKKEVPASSKVASGSPEGLVNRLLANIKLATESMETEQDEEKAEDKDEEKEEGPNTDANKKLSDDQKKLDADSDGKIEAEDLRALREKGASQVSEIDEDALAEKIASHYRNISVGYELGKFLFQAVGQKLANEVAPEMAPEAVPAPTTEPAADDTQSEIEAILTALQELVQEGQITEEQAQQVLMELQASVDGGAQPTAAKEASHVFNQEQVSEIEAAINSKVAEWVAEGITDEEITERVKQSAEADAEMINDQIEAEAQINDLNNKRAALAQLGYSEEQAEEYLKQAFELQAQQEDSNKIHAEIESRVLAKVAELQGLGYNESQIEEYLKQAAQEDARLLQQAAVQEELQKGIRAKVAADRQDKLANVSPEIQQILQALEALLQSGEITEEEAMTVLQELGLTGDGQAAPSAPSEAPVAAEEVAQAAPAPEASPVEKMSSEETTSVTTEVK
jgi:Holliday junction resolvasome RuvABC DNA-binding subunit